MASVVPEIDIAALVTENSTPEARQKVLDNIDDAMKNIGFMSIINHGVPKQLIERMEKTGKDFFYLPSDVKMSIASKKWNAENENRYRGYIPASVFGKECWDIADPCRVEREDPDCYLTEMNKYPDAVTESDRATITEYFTTLHKLTTKLVKAVYTIYGQDPNEVGVNAITHSLLSKNAKY